MTADVYAGDYAVPNGAPAPPPPTYCRHVITADADPDVLCRSETQILYVAIAESIRRSSGN